MLLAGGTVTGGFPALPIHGDEAAPQHLLCGVRELLDPAHASRHYCNAYHNTDSMSRPIAGIARTANFSRGAGYGCLGRITRFLHRKVRRLAVEMGHLGRRVSTAGRGILRDRRAR